MLYLAKVANSAPSKFQPRFLGICSLYPSVNFSSDESLRDNYSQRSDEDLTEPKEDIIYRYNIYQVLKSCAIYLFLILSTLIHDKYILILSRVRLLNASGSTVFFCSMFLQSVWLTELFHAHIADKL